MGLGELVPTKSGLGSGQTKISLIEFVKSFLKNKKNLNTKFVFLAVRENKQKYAEFFDITWKIL